MDLESNKINREALKATAEHFGMTQKEVNAYLRVYSDYIYAQINSIDLDKPLSEQPTRIKIPNVGVILVHRVFIIEDDKRRGKISDHDYHWARVWFSKQFKYYKNIIAKFITNQYRQT